LRLRQITYEEQKGTKERAKWEGGLYVDGKTFQSNGICMVSMVSTLPITGIKIKQRRFL